MNSINNGQFWKDKETGEVVQVGPIGFHTIWYVNAGYGTIKEAWRSCYPPIFWQYFEYLQEGPALRFPEEPRISKWKLFWGRSFLAIIWSFLKVLLWIWIVFAIIGLFFIGTY